MRTRTSRTPTQREGRHTLARRRQHRPLALDPLLDGSHHSRTSKAPQTLQQLNNIDIEWILMQNLNFFPTTSKIDDFTPLIAHALFQRPPCMR